MIELPEALVIADQMNGTILGKKISGVVVGHTPHKLAWYYGEPAEYAGLLSGRTVGKASALGGLVEVPVEDARILLGEGSGIRFNGAGEPRPPKHQLLIEFDDRSSISVLVQMYGGMGAFPAGGLDNPYYKAAKERPSPLCVSFDKAYFDNLVSAPEVQKLSLKAFLATEQRIPGLGNGVLQDILFHARMHPKKKVSTLSGEDREVLFNSLKSTLSAMAAMGGRDTEMDLFGRAGRYKTVLCNHALKGPCLACGTSIKKEAYLGGSIYYCETCQKI